MYAPKNAYQKLLDQFFAKDGGGAQDAPVTASPVTTTAPAEQEPKTTVPVVAPAGSFFVTTDQLRGLLAYMQGIAVDAMVITHKDAQDTFASFGLKAEALDS